MLATDNSRTGASAFAAEHFILSSVAPMNTRPPAVTMEPPIFEVPVIPVKRTIEVLRLNDDPWVKLRFDVLSDYRDRVVTIDFLRRRYPFMASEIERQGVQPKL